MATPTPSPTPNVVIQNPRARVIARTILDIIGVILGTIIVIDGASDLFDAAAVTVPALAGWTYLRLAFGLAIDNTNTPR